MEFAGRGEKRHGNRIMELETVANEGNFFVARARGMWWWESEPGCPGLKWKEVFVLGIC